MTVRSLALVAGLAVVTTGCVTVSPEEIRARDEATCRDYGFRARSEAFSDCLLKLELDRRAERRSQRAEFRAFSEPRIIYQPVYVPRRRP
jgi:hypothetical protein